MNRVFYLLLLHLLIWTTVPAHAAPGPASVEGQFSHRIPNGSAWVINIRKEWELRAAREKKELSAEEKAFRERFAATQVRKVENAYENGIRREVIHYEDGSKLVRYLSKGFVAYTSPKTGKVVLEHSEAPSSGTFRGIDRFEELGWINAGVYSGVEKFQGHSCDVYRQLATNETDAPASQKPKILDIAYIDRQSGSPLAYKTPNETLFYTTGLPFEPFTVPEAISRALQGPASLESKLKRRYNVPQ